MDTNSSDKPNRTGKHVNPSPKKKKKSPAGKIVLFALVALVVVLGIFGSRFLFAPKVAVPADENRVGTKTVGADIFSVRDEAGSLKDNLKRMAEDIKSGNMDAADADLLDVEHSMQNLKAQLGSDVWSSAENAPVIGTEISSVKKLLNIASDAVDEIAKPLMAKMREYPLTEIKVDDAFNAALMYPYIDYLQEIAPYLQSVCDEMQTLDLNLVDREHKISGYTELLSRLLGVYDEYKDMLPMLKDILGEHGDRFYLIVAQNSAETRAAGGFLGAAAYLSVFDHMVRFDDFVPYMALSQRSVAEECNITELEYKLFSKAFYNSHDSCNCPDFERVAEIAATATKNQLIENIKNSNPDVDLSVVTISGVISMTPDMIQRLLTFLGDLTLSDGTVINGTNATKYLQHDLYFRYLGSEKVENGTNIVDQLFAETAKQTFDLILSSFSVNKLMDYVDAFREGVANRNILVWMENEEEQKLIREAGWSGTLNYDPMKPQAGVYFNLLTPSKLGWFLDMETEIGDYTTNADGSRTYKMRVTLRNTLTTKELSKASAYITGGYNGTISGAAYFFAPAGGSVDNFWTDNPRSVIKEHYKDLELGYFFPFIDPGDTFVVTYDLTTAPGVTEDLTISATPTLTQYR